MPTAVDQPPVAFTWSEAQAGARAFSSSNDPVKLLGGGVAAADVGIVLLCSAGAWMRLHAATLPSEILSVTFLAAVLTLNAMFLAGAYRQVPAFTSPVTPASRVALAWSAVFIALMILGYFARTLDTYSQIWAITWYTSALLGLVLVRIAAAAAMRRWEGQGRLARTVAVVDLAGTGETLARGMLASATDKMQLIGVFSPHSSGRSNRSIVDLIALSRRFQIDDVIVVASGNQGEETDRVVRKLGTMPTNVRLCPEMPQVALAPRDVTLLYGQPMLTVYRQPLTGWSRVAKRVEDVALSAAALVLLAPLMALAAFLIKLDSPGPVLFKQKRLGFNNNIIIILKFRTMHHGPVSDTTVSQACRSDPRVTRVGAILRKTSIDELPQLLNVLRGEMSLIGPRPHALAHNDHYAALIDEYLGRHRVQPGMTGWAQVNGLRGETETLDKMRRRVEHDLAYIDGWSLFLDLKILLLTALLLVYDRNAY